MSALAQPPARRLYTVAEISDLTGFSQKTIRRLIKDGTLPTHPAFRGRGMTRFAAAVVDRLLAGEMPDGGGSG